MHITSSWGQTFIVGVRKHKSRLCGLPKNCRSISVRDRAYGSTKHMIVLHTLRRVRQPPPINTSQATQFFRRGGEPKIGRSLATTQQNCVPEFNASPGLDEAHLRPPTPLPQGSHELGGKFRLPVALAGRPHRVPLQVRFWRANSANVNCFRVAPSATLTPKRG